MHYRCLREGTTKGKSRQAFPKTSQWGDSQWHDTQTLVENAFLHVLFIYIFPFKNASILCRLVPAFLWYLRALKLNKKTLRQHRSPCSNTFRRLEKRSEFQRRHLPNKLDSLCQQWSFFLCPPCLFRRVRATNIVRRPCSDSSHVTAPYKLSFYYYYLWTHVAYRWVWSKCQRWWVELEAGGSTAWARLRSCSRRRSDPPKCLPARRLKTPAKKNWIYVTDSNQTNTSVTDQLQGVGRGTS